MSRTNSELETIYAYQADLDTAIAMKDDRKARGIVKALGDAGFETEALFAHQAVNRAFDGNIEPGSREDLVGRYGEDKVEWAENIVESSDYRDEMDRNYP